MNFIKLYCPTGTLDSEIEYSFIIDPNSNIFTKSSKTGKVSWDSITIADAGIYKIEIIGKFI